MYAMIRNDEADKVNSPYCFSISPHLDLREIGGTLMRDIILLRLRML